MAATTKTRKPARRVRLYPSVPALLEMQIGKESFSYFLKAISADWGRAFEVRKLLADGGDVYHVHIDGLRVSCDCIGCQKWGHCKHLEAIQALIHTGKLASLSLAPHHAPQGAAKPEAKPCTFCLRTKCEC
jgi:hypothetical protein